MSLCFGTLFIGVIVSFLNIDLVDQGGYFVCGFPGQILRQRFSASVAVSCTVSVAVDSTAVSAVEPHPETSAKSH